MADTRVPTVLNVNDDEVARYALSRMLRRAGFLVIEAASAREALQRAATKPDLVLLDVRLPDMSGREVLRLLKRDPTTTSIPVVLTSAAFVSSEDRANWIDRDGADGVLEQPVDAESLARTIGRIVSARGVEGEPGESRRQSLCVLDEKGRFVRANDAVADLFGKPRSALLDAGFEEAVVAAFGSVGGRALVEAAACPIEPTVVVLQFGEQRLVASIEPDAGRELVVVRITTAPAHADDLERERAARRDAEHASAMKDELLAVVSHELRTPLTAMAGWVRMLRDGKVESSRVASALETIERNAVAQAKIVDDLLDGSRIMAGKLRLDVRPVDFTEIVRVAVETARPSAIHKGVRLQFEPSGQQVVDGDAERLQQVVGNLLSNALKFTPGGGSVDVRLAVDDSRRVALTVVDSGAGIAPEFLPYVFDRFRQADGSIQRTHGGLGLGLAIVRHLVEMHGGESRAESEGIQRGATFTVLLPSSDLALPATRPTPPDSMVAVESATLRLAGLRVVVVDDDPDLRELLSTILVEQGAHVVAVGSAHEGLEAIRSLRPDVLVSDIGMPGEDGLALMKRVRSLDAVRGGDTPAAALTAYAHARDGAAALAVGFDLHLAKPVDPDVLVNAVARLARSKRMS